MTSSKQRHISNNGREGLVMHLEKYFSSQMNQSVLVTSNNGYKNFNDSTTEHTDYLYEGWNFNFGNTPLDWIQELLE